MLFEEDLPKKMTLSQDHNHDQELNRKKKLGEGISGRGYSYVRT